MIKDGFGIYPGRSDRDQNGNPIYITGASPQGWINVYALKRRDGKAYFRFGYNVQEQRWAYGLRPKIDESIFSEPAGNKSGGSGWRILRTLFGFAASVIFALASAVVWIFVVFLTAFFSASLKPRRRRRRWL